jgi:SAM-dependent methyltransferase
MRGLEGIQGTVRYVRAHWPVYVAGYSLVVLALGFITLSAGLGWWSFVPLTLVLLLLIVYFTLASLWAAHKLYDVNGIRPHHVLFDMAQIQANDTFAYVDLGLRYRAIELARRMTIGRAIVVDVYSPQWTPSRALVRWRNRMSAASQDPRMEWRSGNISLLPLPDHSVTAVIVCQIVSEFWQDGDQSLLLKEIFRILAPNGRVLLAERARTEINWLLMGPMAFNLPPVEKWRTMLTRAGFRVRNERELGGLVHCIRADKPTPTEAQQLALGLEL